RLIFTEVPVVGGFEIALLRKLGVGESPSTHLLDFLPLGHRSGVVFGECELTGYSGALRLTQVRATLRGAMFATGDPKERLLAANRSLWSEHPRGHPLGLA